MPLSHAAIYDMDNDEVIEADGSSYYEIEGFFSKIAKSDGDSADVGERADKDNRC
ncbi:MAG: hypothetical protein LBF13_01800 [Campylobacteraceae bacterium]|nr:hypothetical protein [Campylobacteraceae bacterium]